MTSEENHRVPLSIDASSRGTEGDPQLSACAQEGSPAEGLLKTPSQERRRSATQRAQAERSSNTERLAVGQLLGGRYRIERELGEGGMGVVYLAADEQVPGERFAVKVLKEEMRPWALTLLIEEVHKTRKLSHPNIVDVHSVNVDGQRLYLLMEYLEGKSLDMLLDEEFGRGMPLSHAWPLIEDVGAALGYAHNHNVIHSDLKPANVFLTTAGRTKLLDFGIARVSRGPLLHARSGPRALTPSYASCEMLEGKDADPRDDIYSFACVIYEMLCGERPFGELTAPEARENAARMRPLEGLSEEQNAALAKALAFHREARTGAVETLLAELAAHTAPRSRPVALLGAAAILVVIAAVGVTYFALDRRWVSRHSVAVEQASSTAQPAAAPTTAPATPTASSNSPPFSIAVLPFVNISGDPKQEYFSDGLSEELIDHLVRSPDLKVIARTSSFQFKGRNEDARSIASKLGVAHLLEGSVRKADHALRITVQLVRASDGTQLWSQTYDRRLVDIFKVQDEIAGKVAQALHVTLANSDQTRSPQPDVEAYNFVLEGNYFKARWTQPDLERAIQLYRKALDIRPDYALAWARLAGAYFDQQALTGTASAVGNRRILDALDRANRLDPKLALAYFTRAGFDLTVSWDWKAAAANVERVRELEPGSDLLPRALGALALTFGQVDRAVELYEKALERDPLAALSLVYLGDALCAANRTHECLQTRLRLLQLHPEFGGVYSTLGATQLQAGLYAEALDSMQKEPEENYRLAGLAMAYSAMGRRADSDAALQALEGKFALTDAYAIAEAHSYRGEIDVAFRWLDRAYRQRDTEMSSVMADPLLRNLRDDRRFHALLVKLRLVPEKAALTDEGRI